MIKQIFACLRETFWLNDFRMLFLLPVYIAFLAGCQKVVTNVKLPETEPKLVIGCFISPQEDTITVTVSRSNPVFGSGHNNANILSVPDASVVISNGSNSIAVPYNNINEQYELKSSLFPITAGQTYYLNVTTPKGENVSSSCTVPASNLTSLTVDFIDTTTSQHKKINVKWQDIPNETNYYRIYVQMGTIDPFLIDTIYNIMYSENSLQNDKEKDGKEMSSFTEGGYYGSGTLKIFAFDIYLLNIDAEYYKYQYSLDHYTYGDPFSEPSLIYTNINGGLGIFAAYNTYYQKINI